VTLTKEQIELRRMRIGASEIGAVLGIDKYRTPLQLWMDKKGMAREHNGAHLGWGHDVEGAILRNYARRNGYELLPSPGTMAHPTLPHLCATPDGLAVRNGVVRDVQAKNVEEHHVREWGEPGTSDAPLFYVAQVTVELGILRGQMHDLDDGGDIAVSFGGRPPVGYPIPFNVELFGNLSEAASKFVRDYLETNKPPPLEGDRAALEYVKRRFAKSTGELLEPTSEAQHLVARLRLLKEDAAEHEKEIEEAQAQLCALIGDALGFDGLCTWSVVKEQRKAFTDWPMVAQHLAVKAGVSQEQVKQLVADLTREEVVKESYRRLSLAKERKSK